MIKKLFLFVFSYFLFTLQLSYSKDQNIDIVKSLINDGKAALEAMLRSDFELSATVVQTNQKLKEKIEAGLISGENSVILKEEYDITEKLSANKDYLIDMKTTYHVASVNKEKTDIDLDTQHVIKQRDMKLLQGDDEIRGYLSIDPTEAAHWNIKDRKSLDTYTTHHNSLLPMLYPLYFPKQSGVDIAYYLKAFHNDYCSIESIEGTQWLKIAFFLNEQQDKFSFIVDAKNSTKFDSITEYDNMGSLKYHAQFEYNDGDPYPNRVVEYRFHTYNLAKAVTEDLDKKASNIREILIDRITFNNEEPSSLRDLSLFSEGDVIVDSRKKITFRVGDPDSVKPLVLKPGSEHKKEQLLHKEN
jgi:hypothetical protein